MTENNLQTKQAFICQYYGQAVCKQYKETTESGESGSSGRLNHYDIAFSQECILNLRRLTKATHDELIDLCYEAFPFAFNGNSPKGLWKVLIENDIASISHSKSRISFALDLIEYTSIDTFIDNEPHPVSDQVIAIDYLRSNGFAIPFRNLSVETLIEFGWINLI